MSDKKKDLAAQSRREDEVLNRTLLWMGGAAILVLLLLLVNRYYVNYRTNEIDLMVLLQDTLLPIFTLVSAALCAVGAGLGLAARKKGKTAKWWVTLAIFFGALAVSLLLVWRFHRIGVQAACALVPATAVLALVYYLFQREFFLISLLSAVGIAGLWMVRQAGENHRTLLYAYLVFTAVVLVAAALFTRKVQQAGGLWKEKRLLSKNAAYSMVYVTCALVAVLLIAAVVAGAGVAYYLLFPAIGWLVVMAVFFTVKLM